MEDTKDMRLAGIDLLRGIAAFGIVGCHIQLAPRTCAGNLVVALCDFNVGVFAALAGFLMCGAANVDGWLGYVKKRANRLLPTYFAWTIVYVLVTALFDVVYDGGCLNPRYMDVWFWLRVIFRGGCAAHLWFLVCLFYAQVAFFGLFASLNDKWWGFAWIVAGGVVIAVSASLTCWIGCYPLRLVAFLVTGFGIGCCYRGGMFYWLGKCRWMAWGLALAVLVAHVAMIDYVHKFIRDWIAVGPVLLAFVGICVNKRIAIKMRLFTVS